MAVNYIHFSHKMAGMCMSMKNMGMPYCFLALGQEKLYNKKKTQHRRNGRHEKKGYEINRYRSCSGDFFLLAE